MMKADVEIEPLSKFIEALDPWLGQVVLDGRWESAHSTRTFSLQFPLGGFSHAEIKIADCSGSDHGIDSSPQSNSIRHFRRDLYRFRSLPCVQEL